MKQPGKPENFSVAVPWSLSHYIPLNGFHPLYRPLFEECPDYVTVNAWDNIALSNTMREVPAVRTEILNYVSAWEARLNLRQAPLVKQEYYGAFDVSNLAATALLPGDIELHHTAPFPSMTRPFLIHCESLAAFFIPFTQPGGTSTQAIATRAHYTEMLEHPFCLGIVSHIPDTLEDLSRFFQSAVINRKLFPSRIGVSRHAVAPAQRRNRDLAAPVFVFISSANENPLNFIHRGGHIVLRAWPDILAAWPAARLYLRGARPADALLQQHGVDIAFAAREHSHSIIWIEEFLTKRELDNLIRAAHFFLLPSTALHSVSIMQAMASGAVPVIADTVGASRYLSDAQTSIVLQGRDAARDESLVNQLIMRVDAVWRDPDAYAALQDRAMAHAAAEFAGPGFAEDFWAQAHGLWAASPAREVGEAAPFASIGALRDCLVAPDSWPRLFESRPQPMRRLYTGAGQVTELGGSFIYTRPGEIDLHGWSVFAEYRRDNPVASRMAASIAALGGVFLPSPARLQVQARRRIVQWVAQLLMPAPFLYRIASRALKMARRLRARWAIAPAPEPLDIQLVEQNVSGMNVIRCGDLYVAIPQEAGEFSLAKLNKGRYRLSFTGNSPRQVMDMIAEHDAKHGAKSLSAAVELLEEGYHGLNLIRYGELFLAIPQGEGVLDYDRVITQGYSRSFSETSLTALKTSITQASP
jgi:glycosyltransferase involved in cell wall biosynthesis